MKQKKLKNPKSHPKSKKKQPCNAEESVTKKPLVDLRQFEPLIASPAQRTLQFHLCPSNCNAGFVHHEQKFDGGLAFRSDMGSESLGLILSPDALSVTYGACKQHYESLLEMKYTIMSVRVRFGMDIWSLAAQLVNPFEILPCVASPVLNRAFFKMWELLKVFDLVPAVVDKPRFVSVHLCEGPGGFIQAIQGYRDIGAGKNSIEDDDYCKDYGQDTSSGGQAIPNRIEETTANHCERLHTESGFTCSLITSRVREDLWFALTLSPRTHSLVDKILSKGCSNRLHPPQVDIRKLGKGASSYLKGYVHYGADQSGDITNPANISSFVDYVMKCNKGQKVGLVTADGALDVSDDFSLQEQSHLQLKFCEICTAVRLQAKGGTLVLKIFDCFTEATITLLAILSSLYKHLDIARLRTSRICNSERYIIAKEFQELTPQLEERLMALASDWYKASQNGENVGVRVLNGPPKEFFETLFLSNAVIAKTQYEAITKAVYVASVLGNLLPDTFERRRGLVSMLRRKMKVLNTMQQNAFALCNDLNIPLHNKHSIV